MNAISNVMTIVSGIVTLVAFSLALRASSTRFLHGFYILVIVLAVSYGEYEYLKNARMHDTIAAAKTLTTHWDMNYTEKGYVHAVLLFLETNKDLYPDVYARDTQEYNDIKGKPDEDRKIIDLAYAFDGDVKKIADTPQ
jgi:hypothetical protein